MFEFFNFARKRRLSLDQLQTLQMVAQQVVLSLEGSVGDVTPSASSVHGAAKKALALKLMGELLEQLGIVAPDSLIDVSVEAAVKLLKALESEALPPRSTQSLPPEPRPKPVSGVTLDVSGRPPTGNSEKGLSL